MVKQRSTLIQELLSCLSKVKEIDVEKLIAEIMLKKGIARRTTMECIKALVITNNAVLDGNVLRRK